MFLNVVVCPEINFNNRKDANNIFMQKVAHKMMIKIDIDHRPNSITFPAQNVILSYGVQWNFRNEIFEKL